MISNTTLTTAVLIMKPVWAWQLPHCMQFGTVELMSEILFKVCILLYTTYVRCLLTCDPIDPERPTGPGAPGPPVAPSVPGSPTTPSLPSGP